MHNVRTLLTEEIFIDSPSTPPLECGIPRYHPAGTTTYPLTSSAPTEPRWSPPRPTSPQLRAMPIVMPGHHLDLDAYHCTEDTDARSAATNESLVPVIQRECRQYDHPGLCLQVTRRAPADHPARRDARNSAYGPCHGSDLHKRNGKKAKRGLECGSSPNDSHRHGRPRHEPPQPTVDTRAATSSHASICCRCGLHILSS